MSERTLPVSAILAAGIGLGFAGDQLLRAPGGPGFNFFLLFAALAVSVWVVAQSAQSTLAREAKAWLVVGVLCAAALMWRGSGLLRFLTFVAACTAFALPALQAGRGWVGRARVFDILESIAGAGLFAGLGGVRLLGREHWESVADEGSRSAARTVVRTAVAGLMLALVPLVVFGALFASADQMFAALLSDVFRLDLEAFASHVAVTVILSWLACGYLVGTVVGTRLEPVRRMLPDHPRFGIAAIATALGLVNLLFLGFVTVQFRYLFGGGAWVEITPGLTYAEYGRSGFFQLVAAVGLSIPWLLLTRALLGDADSKSRSIFRGFAGLQVLLLLGIVASAIQRMTVYQSVYGLSELRIIVFATLIWLTFVVLWFGATVLSGRENRFAFGALVTAFVVVGTLQLVDPAGMATRHHLDRTTVLEVEDATYLASLGSDAAPQLIERFDELSEAARCAAAERLLRSWGPERPTDWRSFNWSESRARAAVSGQLNSLEALADSERCAPDAPASRDLPETGVPGGASEREDSDPHP